MEEVDWNDRHDLDEWLPKANGYYPGLLERFKADAKFRAEDYKAAAALYDQAIATMEDTATMIAHWKMRSGTQVPMDRPAEQYADTARVNRAACKQFLALQEFAKSVREQLEDMHGNEDGGRMFCHMMELPVKTDFEKISAPTSG